jgi:hypothetical protein
MQHYSLIYPDQLRYPDKAAGNRPATSLQFPERGNLKAAHKNHRHTRTFLREAGGSLHSNRMSLAPKAASTPRALLLQKLAH